MKTITIEVDNWGHKELKDYLLTVKGIKKVTVDDENLVKVDIEYDSNLITDKMIRMELDLFFDKQKEPSLVSFNKHEEAPNKYTIAIKYLCCEYCLKGMIEDLYDIDGIISASSDFTFLNVEKQKFKNVLINITYNDIITLDRIKEIEKDFNN